MKTTVRALACILAVAPVFACGDDASTVLRDPITAVDSGASAADAGVKPPPLAADGSIADAGGRSDGSIEPGNVDAAMASDGGRDSSAPATTDSATPATTRDSGAATGATDSGQTSVPGTPAQSQACHDCEARRCTTTFYALKVDEQGNQLTTDLTKACSALQGVAADGPGKGKPRSQLCEELVECGRRTGCAHPVEYGCLCGPLELDACQAKSEADGIINLPGPCVKEVRAAGEAVDLEVRPLIDSYTAPANEDSPQGLGTAILLLQCGEQVCTDACYAPCKGAQDQTVCDTYWDSMKITPERMCVGGSCPESTDYAINLGLVDPVAANAGTPSVDAGASRADAGAAPADAGTSPVDSGRPSKFGG
jgi:hypothetical protein